MLNNEENEKGLYNALRIYVDPSTLKAYDAYRNFGTGLLQRFSKDIVGDRSDNKQKLRKEFDALTIKRHEAPTTFCLRARKKQGEMSWIVEVSDKKSIETSVMWYWRSTYGMGTRCHKTQRTKKTHYV